MASSQANRSTGLLVPWPPDDVADDVGGPAHARLAALLREQVVRGVLRPGDRLPPSRILAEDLGLSRWVVTEAYDQLKAEGYLAARVGAGTVVASGVRVPAARPEPAAATAPDVAPGPLLDLSPALPDLSSFPRTAWRAAVARALAEVPDADLARSDPAGAPVLRATVAGYLRRVRGVEADPARVHVTAGVRNGFWLVCDVLRRRGARRVAVEDPCWPRLREAARDSGLQVVPLPVDAEGLQVEGLPAADVDAVFVTPTHQFPTGVPLSAARRRALVDWAAAGDRVLVEDDYDAEFRYDRRPVGALAALAPEHVVYLGSTSKTLSPGLHLGWLVAPDALADDLAAARSRLGALAPTPDQHALAHLVESGSYDRHLRRMRRTYQRRRTAMLAALAASVPGAAWPSMDAGLHVLWLLPDGTSPDGAPQGDSPQGDSPQGDAPQDGTSPVAEDAVLAAARRRGLGVLGLAQCRVAPGRGGLVVGYGNVPEHRAADVAARLGAAVAEAG